jgi:hypothetical protein
MFSPGPFVFEHCLKGGRMTGRFVAKPFLSIIFLLSIATSPLLGQGAAGTGLAFLKLGVGARAVGLGEAYVSVAEDVSAAFWNPAGLAPVDAAQVMLAHTEWLQDITHDYIGFATRGFGGAWGVNLVSAGVGEIESRTKPSTEPIGVFEARNLSLGLSYGRWLGTNLSVGFSLKWLYERIFTYEAAGYAVDLGAQFRLSDSGVRVAAVVQNVGSMQELRRVSSKLPTTLRVGASLPLRFGSSRLLIATDFVKTLDAKSHVNLGGEWLFAERYAFRVGYQSGFEVRGVQGGAGVAVGRFRFDYGFVPVTQGLGNGHRFSVLILI